MKSFLVSALLLAPALVLAQAAPAKSAKPAAKAQSSKTSAKAAPKKVVVAKVDGAVWDLTRPLEGDCALQLLSFDDAEGKEVRACP